MTPHETPDRRPPSARGPIGRALTERLPYKAAALFFSLALWLVVAGAETAERVVPVRVEARLESGDALAVAPPAPAVSAVVVGRARDLVALARDGPLVARRVVPAAEAAAATGDSVRVDLRPADVELPSRSGAGGGSSSGEGVVVRDVRPRAVTLHLLVRAPAGAGR